MEIVLHFLRALLLAVAAAVTVSYIIRRYEIGNRDTNAAGAGSMSAAQRTLGIAEEILATFLVVLFYPLGYVLKECSRTGLRWGERPIILCHGYNHNKSAFVILGHRLRNAGWNNLVAPNFGPASESIPCFAGQLSEKVKQAMSQTGCDKVDLIGHSMGGLVVRYFIEKLGGSCCVETAITLGAPHRGTKMAALGIFRSARQFRPDSDLIKDLCETPHQHNAVNMVSIWSEFDNIVLPPENALLPEPANAIMIQNVGHIAMLFSGKVFAEVRKTLSRGVGSRKLIVEGPEGLDYKNSRNQT
ncbi:hypothetical protein HZA56_07285 [Candidatus Poribacteria bacterium]|nr:hypothetical protein [Candidatus Poribacteria bacterium]